MRAIKILADSKGGHGWQKCNIPFPLLEGWAVIPDDMETPNFPYGDIEVEEINGVMTVTKWTPGVIPEPEPTPEAEPSAEDMLNALVGGMSYE